MAKNKNFIASTGIVGLTALALTVSPALAVPNTATETEKDARAIVHTVGALGQTVSVVEEDLQLPEDVDFSTFAAAVEKDAENVTTEDILDEKDVKTGEKTFLTTEKQGVWTFESDLDGNLLNIEFVPAEGFTGDPVLDYVSADVEGTETTGTITLDYPNEDKAEDVKPLTEAELTELEKAEAEAKASEEKVAEEAADSEKVEKPVAEEEQADKPVVEDKVAEDTVVEDKGTVEEAKPAVVKVQPRLFSAGGLVAPALVAPVAPAAPAPAEGLDANFAIPALQGQSGGKIVTLTFGDNGEKLPEGADAGTLQLVIGESAAENVSLSSDRRQLDLPNVGTFKIVEGNNAFTFEPVAGYEGTAVGHYTVQDNIGNFSNEGTLTVGVKAGAENDTDVDDTRDDETGVVVDENGNEIVSDEPVAEDTPSATDDISVDENGNVITDETSADEAESANTRSNLSNTGVDAAPAGIIAAALAFVGTAFAVVSSRLRRNTTN